MDDILRQSGKVSIGGNGGIPSLPVMSGTAESALLPHYEAMILQQQLRYASNAIQPPMPQPHFIPPAAYAEYFTAASRLYEQTLMQLAAIQSTPSHRSHSSRSLMLPTCLSASPPAKIARSAQRYSDPALATAKGATVSCNEQECCSSLCRTVSTKSFAIPSATSPLATPTAEIRNSSVIRLNPMHSTVMSPVTAEADSTKNDEQQVDLSEEPDEEELIIDVETVCSEPVSTTPTSPLLIDLTLESTLAKKKRKDHIAFFQQLKTVKRLNKTQKTAVCRLCSKSVTPNDTELREHISEHSTKSLFQCLLCDAYTAKLRMTMFEHLRDTHPQHGGTSSYRDVRDFEELTAILNQCFPKLERTGARAVFNQRLDQVSTNVEQRTVSKIKCQICRRFVVADRDSVSEHAGTHRYLRCFHCKDVLSTKSALVRHFHSVHATPTAQESTGGKMAKTKKPREGKDYSWVMKADVMADILLRCFPSYVNE